MSVHFVIGNCQYYMISTIVIKWKQKLSREQQEHSALIETPLYYISVIENSPLFYISKKY